MRLCRRVLWFVPCLMFFTLQIHTPVAPRLFFSPSSLLSPSLSQYSSMMTIWSVTPFLVIKSNRDSPAIFLDCSSVQRTPALTQVTTHLQTETLFIIVCSNCGFINSSILGLWTRLYPSLTHPTCHFSSFFAFSLSSSYLRLWTTISDIWLSLDSRVVKFIVQIMSKFCHMDRSWWSLTIRIEFYKSANSPSPVVIFELPFGLLCSSRDVTSPHLSLKNKKINLQCRLDKLNSPDRKSVV